MRELSFALNPPEPIRTIHQLGDFDCGIPELNSWLQQRAVANQESGLPERSSFIGNKR